MTKPIIKSGPLSVRSMVQADFALMSKWLADPVVQEFYEGRDYDVKAKIQKEYFSKDLIKRAIVEWDGRPIGYVQYYSMDDDPESKPVKTGSYGYRPGDLIYAMDVFIGEPDKWGRGIGTKLIKLMVKYVQTKYHPDKITLDPYQGNPRAVRAYEKAGFKIIRPLPEYDTLEGKKVDGWLMEYQG